MCLKELLDGDFLRMGIDKAMCLRELLYIPCQQRATKTFLPAEINMDSSWKLVSSNFH